MCKDAKTLLDDLKRGVHFFKVQDYQYQDYEGEIAEIAKYCQQGNAQAILSILKNKNTQKTFEIKHPLYNDIILRAVYSIANHANNYVFFVDSSNTFCLCIVQNCNFVNFFITEQTIFRVSYVWEGAMGGSIGYLCAQSRVRNILPQHITYKESEFAYNLHHCRPAHYFGHMLANYIHLQDKPVFQNQCFFLPKNTKTITESDRVLFYPMTYLHQCLTQSSFLVFNQSLQDFDSLVEPQDKQKYSLTLWIGIPGERRVWLEQWEGIPLILKNLSLYFPSIKVYVDGMTAYDGERIEVTSNLEAFWKIVENTKEVFEAPASLRGSETDEASVAKATDPHLQIHNTESRPQDSKNSCIIYGAKGEQIAFKSLSGYDYRTKICYCAMCDIVISETSTTSLVPFYFCKKPGVVFYSYLGHLNMAQGFTKAIPHLKVIYKQYHKDTREKENWVFNYHIPPEHLYNLAAESLEELSLEGKLANFGKDNPLKMHRLSVPSVELYAKLYELEKKTLVSLKGNRAEQEILEKIESQKKLLEAQKLVSELEKNPIASSISQSKTLQGAKERVHRHLAYKLGVALIVCSKSLWGYIRMPYVLSYIKESHKKEIAEYQAKVAKNPSLKLPPLESYADYKEALKEKECFTYKLGLALMQADKDWIKGGYLRFYFLDVPRLRKEFREKRK